MRPCVRREKLLADSFQGQEDELVISKVLKLEWKLSLLEELVKEVFA